MKPENAVKLDRSIGRLVYKLHLFFYRLTFGLIGHRTSQGRILLLSHVGRKSGIRRTTPLLYMPDGVNFVVVGSNGGRPQPPAWLANLRAGPVTRIQVGRRKLGVTARILSEDDKEVIWPKLTAYYKGWAHYETLTDRTIYPVILVPNGK